LLVPDCRFSRSRGRSGLWFDVGAPQNGFFVRLFDDLSDKQTRLPPQRTAPAVPLRCLPLANRELCMRRYRLGLVVLLYALTSSGGPGKAADPALREIAALPTLGMFQGSGAPGMVSLKCVVQRPASFFSSACSGAGPAANGFAIDFGSELLGFLRRSDPELLTQDASALLKLTSVSFPPSAAQVQPDERSMSRFEQRIQCQQPLGDGYSTIEPFDTCVVANQLREGLHRQLMKATPLGRHPLLEAFFSQAEAAQQLASV
jgi:hypothetical protein